MASRGSAWQEARHALEGDVAKGERRARQLQEKFDGKQKEVVNLLEALKAAEVSMAQLDKIHLQRHSMM